MQLRIILYIILSLFSYLKKFESCLPMFKRARDTLKPIATRLYNDKNPYPIPSPINSIDEQ